MSLKPYEELVKFDVTPYIKERDGIPYLNWADCKQLLHENGAKKVVWEPVINEKTGDMLFRTDKAYADKNGNTNSCYFVAVKVTIDDLEFIQKGPLMNGGNPVKDNSISQQRIHNAHTRQFVKGVAMHTGLGFSLWLNNAEDEIMTDSHEDLVESQNLTLWYEKFGQLLTEKTAEGYTLEEIAQEIGVEYEMLCNGVKAQVIHLVGIENKVRGLKRK